MNVTVALLDGSKIYPAYAPDNSDSILAFYANAVATKQIAGYVARLNNGSTVAEGFVL